MLVFLAGLAVSAWDQNLLTSLYQNVYMGVVYNPLWPDGYRVLRAATTSQQEQMKYTCKRGCGNVNPNHVTRVNEFPARITYDWFAEGSYVLEGEGPRQEICIEPTTNDDGYNTLYKWRFEYSISAGTDGCNGAGNALFFCACPVATIDDIYSIDNEVGRSHLTAEEPMNLEFVNAYTGDQNENPTDTGLLDNQKIWIKFVQATLTLTCEQSAPVEGTEKNLTNTGPGRSGCTLQLPPLRDGIQLRVCYKVLHITGSSNGIDANDPEWSSWRPMGGDRGATPPSESPTYGVFEGNRTTDRTVPYIRERTHLLLTPRFDTSPPQEPDTPALQYSLRYDWVTGNDRKTMTWSILNGTVSTSIIMNQYALASNPLTLNGIPSGQDYIYFDEYPISYWDTFYADCRQVDPNLNASGCSPNVTYASTNEHVRYEFMNEQCLVQPWSPTYDVNIDNMNAMINGTELGYRGEQIQFQVYLDCDPDATDCEDHGGGPGLSGGLTVEFWSSHPRGVLSHEVVSIRYPWTTGLWYCSMHRHRV